MIIVSWTDFWALDWSIKGILCLRVIYGDSRPVPLNSPQNDTSQTVSVHRHGLCARCRWGSMEDVPLQSETKHNHSEIRIQFSLRLLLYEYISVILKSEVIHRKQPKNFTKGESRRLQGSTSETVRAQLWPKLSFCIAVIVYCQSKVKAIHYMLAVAGHHFTQTYGRLLISGPEMLLST